MEVSIPHNENFNIGSSVSLLDKLLRDGLIITRSGTQSICAECLTAHSNERVILWLINYEHADKIMQHNNNTIQ